MKLGRTERMMTINKAPSLEEHLKTLEKTAPDMPDRIAVLAAKFILNLAREWSISEEGKKELRRRKINKLHREEYAKKKASN